MKYSRWRVVESTNTFKWKAKRFLRGEWLVAVIPLTVIIGVITWFIYMLNTPHPEKLQGVWLVPAEENQQLLTFSTRHIKGTDVVHIRIINPETGKIEHHNSFDAKSGNAELRFMTASSLWISTSDNWICLNYPSLKKKWNQKSFFSHVQKIHPEMGEPFSMDLKGCSFKITNKAGKTFFLDVRDLEETKDPLNLCYPFSKSYQIGMLTSYPTPDQRYKPIERVTIEVENVDDKKKKKNHWEQMNLYEKLQADTGFAKYYAVFTPDSNCYFFDGEKLRTLYKLANDSAELKWKPVMNEKVWLEGDFLRPYKEYRDLPANRFIITHDYLAFIHYSTSMDEKENKFRMAGIDLKKEKIIWDTDLSKTKLVSGYKPEQNYIVYNTLVTVWVNGGRNGILTGLDIGSGALKWSIRK